MKTLRAIPLLLIASLAVSSASASPWSTRQMENPDGPGMAFDVLHEGSPAARLIYGEGQAKTFLHIFGPEGEMLTNPGLDAEGNPTGKFPHHRGMFIGWNQIRSELGSDDLWHLHSNEIMETVNVRESAVTATHADVVAEIVWRSSKKDNNDDNALIHETRTIRITKPEGPWSIILDAKFELTAARDLTLGGDLQHAGVHFRAHRDVDSRAAETIYLWDPEVDDGGGRIVNEEMRWCRLIFPLGETWFSTIQLNAPGNPTEELSWRDYGRFGFFFQRDLKKGESISLYHRFITSMVAAPGDGGYDEATTKAIRERSAEAYKSYAERF